MPTVTTPGKYEFDIAMSFAGEDREFVLKIVDKLKDSGISVFYDEHFQAETWGESLPEVLDQIYREKARFVMIFISRFYAEKAWTTHERRSAMARAVEQRSAYILPVRLDGTPLLGLLSSMGYLDATIGPDKIVRIALDKLTGRTATPRAAIPPALNSRGPGSGSGNGGADELAQRRRVVDLLVEAVNVLFSAEEEVIKQFLALASANSRRQKETYERSVSERNGKLEIVVQFHQKASSLLNNRMPVGEFAKFASEIKDIGEMMKALHGRRATASSIAIDRNNLGDKREELRMAKWQYTHALYNAVNLNEGSA